MGKIINEIFTAINRNMTIKRVIVSDRENYDIRQEAAALNWSGRAPSAVEIMGRPIISDTQWRNRG